MFRVGDVIVPKSNNRVDDYYNAYIIIKKNDNGYYDLQIQGTYSNDGVRLKNNICSTNIYTNNHIDPKYWELVNNKPIYRLPSFL